MKEITLAIFASILLIFSSAPMAASQADPAQHKSVKKILKRKQFPPPNHLPRRHPKNQKQLRRRYKTETSSGHLELPKIFPKTKILIFSTYFSFKLGSFVWIQRCDVVSIVTPLFVNFSPHWIVEGIFLPIIKRNFYLCRSINIVSKKRS